MSEEIKLWKRKKIIRIAIIDDCGERFKAVLSDLISADIRCFSIEAIQKEGVNSLLNYDVILVDGTYQDKKTGENSVDLLRRMIKSIPIFQQKSCILLGIDIINAVNTFETSEQYSSRKYDDLSEERKKSRYMIELVNEIMKLPYKIFGNRFGNKMDVMLEFIIETAEHNGLVVTRKLNKGNCRIGILRKVSKLLKPILQIMDAQEQLSIEITRYFSGLKTSNQFEGDAKKSILEIASILLENEHLFISELNILLFLSCKAKENCTEDVSDIDLEIEPNRLIKEVQFFCTDNGNIVEAISMYLEKVSELLEQQRQLGIDMKENENPKNETERFILEVITELSEACIFNYDVITKLLNSLKVLCDSEQVYPPEEGNDPSIVD